MDGPRAGRQLEHPNPRRGRHRWSQAARTHLGHTLTGAGWAALCWFIDPGLLLWMTPVLAGLILSIPVSVWTSRPGPGHFLRRMHLLLTPDETRRPAELSEIDRRMDERAQTKGVHFEAHEGITRAVVDPYVNAVHVSLLEAKPADAAHDHTRGSPNAS